MILWHIAMSGYNGMVMWHVKDDSEYMKKCTDYEVEGVHPWGRSKNLKGGNRGRYEESEDKKLFRLAVNDKTGQDSSNSVSSCVQLFLVWPISGVLEKEQCW